MDQNLQFYKFIKFLNKLKEEKRFAGVKGMRGDNSADHSWRLAMMVFMSAQKYGLKLDLDKAIKLALVHDVVEIIAKDITRADRIKYNISEKDKLKAEQAAIKEIEGKAPQRIGREIKKLWEEYAKRRTREAKIVASLDKIEGLMTFLEKSQPRKYYADYIATYPDAYLQETPELHGLYSQLKKEMKKAYQKNGMEWKKEYDSWSNGI